MRPDSYGDFNETKCIYYFFKVAQITINYIKQINGTASVVSVWGAGPAKDATPWEGKTKACELYLRVALQNWESDEKDGLEGEL